MLPATVLGVLNSALIIRFTRASMLDVLGEDYVRTARAKGLHRHPATSQDGDPGSAWLHVSAGIGTSPYARIRVACRPEATLLTLVAQPR